MRTNFISMHKSDDSNGQKSGNNKKVQINRLSRGTHSIASFVTLSNIQQMCAQSTLLKNATRPNESAKKFTLDKISKFKCHFLKQNSIYQIFYWYFSFNINYLQFDECVSH